MRVIKRRPAADGGRAGRLDGRVTRGVAAVGGEGPQRVSAAMGEARCGVLIKGFVHTGAVAAVDTRSVCCGDPYFCCCFVVACCGQRRHGRPWRHGVVVTVTGTRGITAAWCVFEGS